MQAWKEYSARLTLFSLKRNETDRKGFEGTVERARIALAEAKLLEAIAIYAVDADDAKKQVNDQVKTFEKGNINPVEDLHKYVWAIANKIARNQKVA